MPNMILDSMMTMLLMFVLFNRGIRFIVELYSPYQLWSFKPIKIFVSFLLNSLHHLIIDSLLNFFCHSCHLSNLLLMDLGVFKFHVFTPWTHIPTPLNQWNINHILNLLIILLNQCHDLLILLLMNSILSSIA